MGDPGERLKLLRSAIDSHGSIDCLLVTGGENSRYLSGFSGTNSTLVVTADRAALLTDFRYLEQAAEQAPQFEIVDGGSKPRERLLELLGASSAIGFDQADMRVKQHQALVEGLVAGAALVPAAGLVERLREVKGPEEIDAIRRAAEVADAIYVALENEGLVGRSEREVAWRIETLAHELGADGLSFPSIVAAGAHGALPHAEPRDVEIEAGQLVVLDLGVKLGGYCSDCTRTFATGKLPEDQLAAYELVLEAQLAALAGVKVGAACSAVDALARDLISAGGMGDRFGHSLGHGVGIEVHELPTLSSRSDGVLEAGNVVTVEPGVYVEGGFGVRIEDLVVVTEQGPEVLTPFPKTLVTTA
jgi:Xaa-Pro aminopeptidase